MDPLRKFSIGKLSALEDATVDLAIKFTGTVAFSNSELNFFEQYVITTHFTRC